MTYLLDETAKRLEQRHLLALDTLHPEMVVRALEVCDLTGGRLLIWEGHRSDEAQRRAYSRGYSNAGPGDSPHNCVDAAGRPCSRAVDFVLHPILVRVTPAGTDSRYPNLWEQGTDEARQAWLDLEAAAGLAGLRRVRIKRRGRLVPDLPHCELPEWRSERWSS